MPALLVEEFTGPARRLPVGSVLAPSPRLGPAGYPWGDGEETPIPSACRHDGDGHLTITARRRGPGLWESGRLHTRNRFAFRYGRVEVRMSCTPGLGVWPAVWLKGVGSAWPDGPELDVVELGQGGQVSGAAHSWTGGLADYTHQVTTPDPGDGLMHTYAMDWQPNVVGWEFDGEPYGSLTPADLAEGDAWVFTQPMYLIVNLAMGGAFPGPTDPTTPTPSTLAVDYIHVTQ